MTSPLPTKNVSIKIHHHSYPVSVSGEGIPCLIIGIGSLMEKTLSSTFKKHFKLYSTDLYWDSRNAPQDCSAIDLEQIVTDISLLAESLKLTSFILLAHSAYGLVALEYAKKFKDSLAGIIMIGSPLNSNAQVAAYNQTYFEEHADPYRKSVDTQRRKLFAEKGTESSSLADQFLQEYIHRDGARYWQDPLFDCSFLWEGISLNGELIHRFFTNILPAHDFQKNLFQVLCPVFLAAGRSDYDCCPWMWSEVPFGPPSLTVSCFEKSGHYPHYEEANLFDKKVIAWVEKIK